MDEMENTGFEDFESALFADDYQTGGDEDTEVTETAQAEEEQQPDSDGEDKPESSEEPEDDPEGEDGENGAEGDEKPAGDTDAGQTFTLKVNKEEQQVTLEEMTALAQKGADYDRVKEQNTKNQQTIQQLQAKLDAMTPHQGTLDVLTIIAEKSGSSLDQLAENLYINFRKSAGASEDTAREELKSAKLEKELNTFKAQQTDKQKQENDAETRAQKDMEDFQKEYPDVQLTEELVGKLVADIRGGMSLSAAYRKYEKAQDSARIEELQRQLAAKEQNAKNKQRSPGSQQDSGGRRTRSDYEDFERALFG